MRFLFETNEGKEKPAEEEVVVNHPVTILGQRTLLETTVCQYIKIMKQRII